MLSYMVRIMFKTSFLEPYSLYPFMCKQNYHREDLLSVMAALSLFKLLFYWNVPYVILPTAFLHDLYAHMLHGGKFWMRNTCYFITWTTMLKSWYILFSLLHFHNRLWLISRQQVYEPVLVWTFGWMHSLIQRRCVASLSFSPSLLLSLCSAMARFAPLPPACSQHVSV